MPIDTYDAGNGLIGAGARQLVRHDGKKILDLLPLLLDVDVVAEIDDDFRIPGLRNAEHVLNAAGNLEPLLQRPGDVALHILGRHAGKFGHNADVRRRYLRHHALRDGDEGVCSQGHHKQGYDQGQMREAQGKAWQAEPLLGMGFAGRFVHRLAIAEFQDARRRSLARPP